MRANGTVEEVSSMELASGDLVVVAVGQ